MSSTYAGNDEYPISFDLPDDGDDLDAASVNVAFEALADRTTYLLARTQYHIVDTQQITINDSTQINASGYIFPSSISLTDVRVGDIVEVTCNLRFRTLGDSMHAYVYLDRGKGAEAGNTMVLHDLARMSGIISLPGDSTSSHTCRFISSVMGDTSSINAWTHLDASTSLIVSSGQLIVTVFRTEGVL